MADPKAPERQAPVRADGVDFELSDGQLDQVAGGLGNFAAAGVLKVVAPKPVIDDDDDPRIP